MLHEPLEARQLLAGLTILAHGLNGNVNGWVDTAAEAIADRLGGSDAASVYTMEVENVDGDPLVTSFEPKSGYGDFRRTSTGEVIVRLDWSDVDSGDLTTREVGAAVASYLLSLRTRKQLPPLAELPMHFVGHSRGASLVSEVARLMGRRGVVVDQTTFLDPVDGSVEIFGMSFGDAPVNAWDNVVFADNYWRSDGDDGNFDIDGIPVSGTYQGDLNSTVQQEFFVSAHGAVTAYYIGTIDTDARNGGDHPVLSDWYDESNPDRDETGYAFSRIGGQPRPLSGLSSLGGGGASRRSTGESGSQFPNILSLAARHSKFSTDKLNVVKIQTLDDDSSLTVRVFLDKDSNPYNDNSIIIGKSTVGGGNRTFNKRVNVDGVRGGKYRLMVRVTDSSRHSRWLDRGSVRVVIPDAARAAGSTAFSRIGFNEGVAERRQIFGESEELAELA